MILSGKEILRHLGKEIIIEPFDPSRINPNSYNLSFANELLVYENDLLDMKTPTHPAYHHSAGGTGAGTGAAVSGPDQRVHPHRQIYPHAGGSFLHRDGWDCLSMSQRDLVMSVLRATGRWRSSVSSPSASIRMSRSARSITMTLTANMSPTRAANTRTIPAFSPA